MKQLKRILLSAAVIILAGCAVSTDDTVLISPSIGSGSQTETTRRDSSLPTTVAILPFLNNTESEFAYEVVRRTMANHFSTRNYRWLHWQDVDNRLVLAGLDNVDKVNAMNPDEVAKILGVDGLIYGNITHYNKTFAGIYAQISVGVELRFVNSAGEVLWEVKDVRRSHAGGVSVSPVGLLMNALVAAKHLYGDLNLYRAADDLGRALATDLPAPEVLSQRQKPNVTDVVHSGVGRPLKYGDTLEVGIQGAPGMTAVASIEGIGLIDLREASPGEYIGRASIDRALNLDGVVVTGRLQDSFGQTTSWISPYGLLTVDNTPPGQVVGIESTSKDGAIAVTWQAPADRDIASYQVAVGATETGAATQTFSTENSSYTVTGLTNFVPVYVSVAATDRAGNTGAAGRLRTTAAPDARFSAAPSLASTLPSVISGIHKLTADGNPYFLRGDTRIATDGVLLVGPGVEFQVSPRAKLSVLGELQMFGSNANPVIARDVSGQGFSEFLIIQTKAPVNLSGLSVAGGGIPVQIRAGNPLLANCSLTDSQFNAITISGSARPVIRNCTISGAGASGVIIEGQSQPTFDGNRFVNNEPFHVQNGSTFEVNATNNSFEPPASPMTVLGAVRY